MIQWSYVFQPTFLPRKLQERFAREVSSSIILLLLFIFMYLHIVVKYDINTILIR